MDLCCCDKDYVMDRDIQGRFFRAKRIKEIPYEE